MNESDYIGEKEAIALGRLRRAIHMHNPAKVFALLSGGHDSLSATILAMQHPKTFSAVHINTGIGVEGTRQFVRETCEDHNWRLLEYKAEENTLADGTPDPMIYEDIVINNGFPGPAMHSVMYIKLKDRQLKRLERDHGIGGRGMFKRRIAYISGVRIQESKRRMGHVNEVTIEGSRVWIAPILDWSKLDTTLYIQRNGFKRNPIVDLIHKSGECLCGAFSEDTELNELAMWDETRPAYERIKKLEDRARCKGIARCQWGGRKDEQSTGAPPGMLCHSCHK